ncbi:hypothetical protein K8R47_00305 [archaeon]|nr:hypothetical protein [archaeon]
MEPKIVKITGEYSQDGNIREFNGSLTYFPDGRVIDYINDPSDKPKTVLGIHKDNNLNLLVLHPMKYPIICALSSTSETDYSGKWGFYDLGEYTRMLGGIPEITKAVYENNPKTKIQILKKITLGKIDLWLPKQMLHIGDSDKDVRLTLESSLK